MLTSGIQPQVRGRKLGVEFAERADLDGAVLAQLLVGRPDLLFARQHEVAVFEPVADLGGRQRNAGLFPEDVPDGFGLAVAVAGLEAHQRHLPLVFDAEAVFEHALVLRAGLTHHQATS